MSSHCGKTDNLEIGFISSFKSLKIAVQVKPLYCVNIALQKKHELAQMASYMEVQGRGVLASA